MTTPPHRDPHLLPRRLCPQQHPFRILHQRQHHLLQQRQYQHQPPHQPPANHPLLVLLQNKLTLLFLSAATFAGVRLLRSTVRILHPTHPSPWRKSPRITAAAIAVRCLLHTTRSTLLRPNTPPYLLANTSIPPLQSDGGG